MPQETLAIADPIFPELRPTDLVFPLAVPPLNDFVGKDPHAKPADVQTRFGGPRDGGKRRHAGVDLEAAAGTAVIAMADGVVLRKGPFYQDTAVIEVMHPRLGIIRYGEVDMQRTAMVFEGQKVKRGQTIGFVGRRLGASRFMLHLELYSNWHATDVGIGRPEKLSQDQGAFKRRSDLRNPTAMLSGGPVLRSLQHVTLLKNPFTLQSSPALNQSQQILLQHLLTHACVKTVCPADVR